MRYFVFQPGRVVTLVEEKQVCFDYMLLTNAKLCVRKLTLSFPQINLSLDIWLFR